MGSFARYHGALLRKAQRLLGNRADAQDVVQSLFTDLIERGESCDLPYLYRATTNRCLTLLRDQRNRERLLVAHDSLLRGAVRTRCDDQVIDLDLLLKLSRSLDERQLEVLCYRFFDDMTQDEIASMIGLSRKTVQKVVDEIRLAVTELAS